MVVMNKLEIKNWVEANPKLVNMRESINYPGLFVLKYKKTVFYKDLWNRYLEKCRGTVIDADFNIVSMPFQKIYNFGIESSAPDLADDVGIDAYRKINGFMVGVTWHNGDILVSTTGSLDSDFCKMARDHIDVDVYRSVCQENPDLTFMFECVHENDPHIVPEKPGMYLIGYRKKSWGSRVTIDPVRIAVLGIQLGCLPVESFRTTVGELKKIVKDVSHEGFVMYSDDGLASKIKSQYYLTCKWVARNPNTEKLMGDKFKEQVEEEFYPLIDRIRENIVEYTALNEQHRLSWVRDFLEAE